MKTILNFRNGCLALLITACVATTSAASDIAITPDLKSIAEAGEVVIGVRESAIPFSYFTKNGSAAGYSIAICEKVVDNLRKVLNRPDLRVRYNNVTAMTRGLLVRERVVDLECGTTSHTAGRAKDFAFSLAFGVEKAALISPVAAPVATLNGLTSAQKILVIEGSTSQQFLQERKQAGAFAAEIVPVRSGARAYHALKDRKAHAYFGASETFRGDMLLHGGRIAEFTVNQIPGSVEPLAVMMRRDRPGLKAVTDRTVADLAQSGELRTAYRAWFEQPIRGYGLNLALAPTPEWQAMLAAPHDRPAE